MQTQQTRTQNLHPWVTFDEGPALPADGEEADLCRSFISHNARENANWMV
jgi:hypothetical protein